MRWMASRIFSVLAGALWQVLANNSDKECMLWGDTELPELCGQCSSICSDSVTSADNLFRKGS